MPSSTVMKDASPTVNAGSRMCQAMTQTNCRRERRSASKSKDELLLVILGEKDRNGRHYKPFVFKSSETFGRSARELRKDRKVLERRSCTTLAALGKA